MVVIGNRACCETECNDRDSESLIELLTKIKFFAGANHAARDDYLACCVSPNGITRDFVGSLTSRTGEHRSIRFVWLAGYRITVLAAEGNVHWVVSGSFGFKVKAGL